MLKKIDGFYFIKFIKIFKMSYSFVDKNGVGYTVLSSLPSNSNFKICNCPKKWNPYLHGHHPSCIRAPTCFFCQMTKNMCKRLGICKGGSFKANPRKTNAEQQIRDDIHQNLKASLQRLFQQIAPINQQIPSSDKKKACIRRALDCRSQYETMKLLQNVSAADIDSAEKCLCRLKCVYFDMKNMLKEQKSSEKQFSGS